MSSHPIDKHPSAIFTTLMTVRIFPSPNTAGICLPITISDKTTISDLKIYVAKKGYPAHEQNIKLRKNGSKVLENNVILWELGIRAGSMPVHLGVFVGWSGVAKGWVHTQPLKVAPEVV